MKKDIWKFRVRALRTLASPYSKDDEDESTFETIYYLLVNMKNLPINIPMDVNPRVPKMTTNPAKNLKAAVVEPETDFYLNNRGIVISAKSLVFDSSSSIVTVDLGDQSEDSDKNQFGILDGGHTYKAIIDQRDKIPDDIEKYVRMEVVTNVQNVTRLSDARNTSVQVTDIALFNLDDKFENIKESIKGQSYANKIAYKDNENKEIGIAELLRLMYAFDIESFPDDLSAPIQSYSGKAQVFKRYKAACDAPLYLSLVRHLPDLVLLYDTIEREISEKYKDYKKAQGVTNPRFGRVRGIEPNIKENGENHSYYSFFLKKELEYKISTGYIYPIFGAFRSLLYLDGKTEEVAWLFDPIEVWNDVGMSLVQNTFESFSNPQLAGKDKPLWLANYRIVETQSLRKMLKQKS